MNFVTCEDKLNTESRQYLYFGLDDDGNVFTGSDKLLTGSASFRGTSVSPDVWDADGTLSVKALSTNCLGSSPASSE